MRRVTEPAVGGAGKNKTITKGIQKVRSFYYKMTSQAKNFVVMIKLTIIEVSTQNIMFTTFLVSSLGFYVCIHMYPRIHALLFRTLLSSMAGSRYRIRFY